MLTGGVSEAGGGVDLFLGGIARIGDSGIVGFKMDLITGIACEHQHAASELGYARCTFCRFPAVSPSTSNPPGPSDLLLVRRPFPFDNSSPKDIP